MRRRRRWLLLFLALIITAVIIWLIVRARSTEALFGPLVALCPGPDLYGYTCTDGGGFAYIDATTDTGLATLDGTTTLQLPFPFTFYGTTYTSVEASSNGNLQFGNANPAFLHTCLDSEPAVRMGDMIAPYWTDLDLTFYGRLDYETVGEAPNRIFVVEWDDVPPFLHEPDDSLTFSVQLFEGSNDIVFLYEDVTLLNNNGNGRLATIGIQSENQGTALQLGCSQASVADASRLHILHPEAANNDLGQTAVIATYQETTLQLIPRGTTATLLDQLNLHGTTALADLQLRWFNQSPSRQSVWQWADVTGNGRSDLIMVWNGDAQHPEFTQVAIVTANEGGLYELHFDQRLSTKDNLVTQVQIEAVADLTNDAIADIVLRDSVLQQVFIIVLPDLILHTLPEQCSGSFGVLDLNDDGQLDIVRDGCQSNGRIGYHWDEGAFQQHPK